MTAANRQHGNAHGHERFQGASGLAIGAVLARITCLCLGVNRPAIGAPARCTTALTPSSRPGSGFSEFQRRSLGGLGARRTSRITVCRPRTPWPACRARPASYPVAPVTRQGHRPRRRWRVAHAGAASPEAGRPA
jgi:hypothetical protein